jgi:hypothetical protein
MLQAPHLLKTWVTSEAIGMRIKLSEVNWKAMDMTYSNNKHKTHSCCFSAVALL